MGLLPIVLASFLVFRRDQERSEVLEDPEKVRRDAEPAANDNDSAQGSEPQDADEDEHVHEGLSPPGRRATFGTSTAPPEKVPAKPGLLPKPKTVAFPLQEENKPLAGHRILPVISGLVVPFAILLEISGLTDSWYIRTNRNVVVESLPNPTSIRVMLTTSILFAVVANVSLIFRFLERAPVLVTTLIAMASLTVHGKGTLSEPYP